MNAILRFRGRAWIQDDDLSWVPTAGPPPALKIGDIQLVFSSSVDLDPLKLQSVHLLFHKLTVARSPGPGFVSTGGINASWDEALTATMRVHDLAIAEESLADERLQDLAG
jgi:hypothetical protein